MAKITKALRKRMERMQEHEAIPVTVTVDNGRQFSIRLHQNSIPKAARMYRISKLDYEEGKQHGNYSK